MKRQDRAAVVLKRLRTSTDKNSEFIQWSTPLELVVGVVLSAQCTDKRVNMVTKELFKKYKTAADYANARLQTLEKEIKSTGFYKAKAKYLKGIGQVLKQRFNGAVPDTLDQVLQLPGVAHKSAYIILSKVHNVHEGVAVDTHVRRVAPRLGLSRHSEPNMISKDLSKLYKPKEYPEINELLIIHGRNTCKPKPRCTECKLQDMCPSAKRFSA